jgi:hypothetical protein
LHLLKNITTDKGAETGRHRNIKNRSRKFVLFKETVLAMLWKISQLKKSIKIQRERNQSL